MYVFLNDGLVPKSEAVVSVYDHGFLYGDGIYETMRVYERVIFRAERHLERLARSAELIRLALPEKGFIREAIVQTLDANGLSNAYVRVTVSRGMGAIGLDPALCERPTFVVFAETFKEYPQSYYTEGISLIIAGTRRNLREAVDPKIKSLNFLNNILAKIEAKDAGAYEALMLSAEGYLSEGTVSNIFFVKDGSLCTPSPDVGILDGITRGLVLSLARNAGIEVREESFIPSDLFDASEVFITNTTSEVMPVSRIGDREYPVGEMTARLRRLYREEVAKCVARERFDA